MDIHYNAFISYRHHPTDIKVAEQIHRGLEHYRVPKALKKTRDTKLRLFRDKEELPITSNLSDDITRALENSDFLIVICSTHTKESLWVQREIETFLQTHDHSRVLTVLVDGEPYDTIPEILCSREGIDPVTGEKRTVPIEPLSCDWRISCRRAKREELPRLAAALLGCGYDELRQREKQYRTRRLAAVLSVALAATMAFTSYVIYNSIQIRKANEQLEQANIEIRSNLEQAQINQSKYLAGSAEQRLEAGDRMLAMALAMEALPEYEGQRPYVARAERALGEAVGIYIAEEEAGTVGCITCDALINLFEATENRDRMFVFDQRYVLSVWDIQTCRKLSSVQLDSNASELLVTAGDGVILRCGMQVRSYDKDLNLLWQMDSITDAAMSEDRQILLAEQENSTLRYLDTVTGADRYEPIRIPAEREDGSTGWSMMFSQETYDPDRPLALVCSKFGQPECVMLADRESGACTVLNSLPEDFDIRITGRTAEGNVLAVAAGENGMWNGRFGTMMTYSQVPILVRCISPAGVQLWERELTSYSYSSESTLYEIPGTGRIFCQVDNLLTVLDAATGNVITSCETGAMPVWVRPYETYALALLEDGSAGSFQYDDNTFNSLPYFKEGIADGFGGKGFFVKQQFSPSILIYGSIMDDNWQMFEGTYSAEAETAVAVGDYLAVSNSDAVLLFDVRQQKLIWSIEETAGLHFRLLGFTGGGEKLWFCNNGKELACLNCADGDYEIYEMPAEVDGEIMYYSHIYRSLMADGMIYLQAKGLHNNIYYVLAFDTETRQSFPAQVCLPENTYSNSQTGILTACDGQAYFWEDSERKLYEVRIREGESEVVLEDTETRPVIQFLNDGTTVMLAVDNQVTFRDLAGQILFTADMGDGNGVSAHCMDEEILLLADSGDFLRFDFTGRKLGELEGHQYTSFFNNLNYGFEPERITWNETGDGDLFVNVFRSGNLIDTKQWQLRAWVPNCVAYLPEIDRFATSGKDPETGLERLGIYCRYSLEQIKDMAREALGIFELTNEQKEQYGIS